MRRSTLELLELFLWFADDLTHPTFRNLTASYESWCYRRGFWRSLAALEKRHLVERRSPGSPDRWWRLTEKGRVLALGGRDPVRRWERNWDGRWRLAVFDVPVEQEARRARLRRRLRSRGFGCLQGSVWVTPDPLLSERGDLLGGAVDVSSLILLEAKPCAGEKDAEIVTAAWDFRDINQRYADHLECLDQCPADRLRDRQCATILARWAMRERQAWLRAVAADPLLPVCLLPADYLGRPAWRRRQEVLRRASELAGTLRLERPD